MSWHSRRKSDLMMAALLWVAALGIVTRAQSISCPLCAGGAEPLYGGGRMPPDSTGKVWRCDDSAARGGFEVTSENACLDIQLVASAHCGCPLPNVESLTCPFCPDGFDVFPPDLDKVVAKQDDGVELTCGRLVGATVFFNEGNCGRLQGLSEPCRCGETRSPTQSPAPTVGPTRTPSAASLTAVPALPTLSPTLTPVASNATTTTTTTPSSAPTGAPQTGAPVTVAPVTVAPVALPAVPTAAPSGAAPVATTAPPVVPGTCTFCADGSVPLYLDAIIVDDPDPRTCRDYMEGVPITPAFQSDAQVCESIQFLGAAVCGCPPPPNSEEITDCRLCPNGPPPLDLVTPVATDPTNGDLLNCLDFVTSAAGVPPIDCESFVEDAQRLCPCAPPMEETPPPTTGDANTGASFPTPVPAAPTVAPTNATATTTTLAPTNATVATTLAPTNATVTTTLAPTNATVTTTLAPTNSTVTATLAPTNATVTATEAPTTPGENETATSTASPTTTTVVNETTSAAPSSQPSAVLATLAPTADNTTTDVISTAAPTTTTTTTTPVTNETEGTFNNETEGGPPTITPNDNNNSTDNTENDNTNSTSSSKDPLGNGTTVRDFSSTNLAVTSDRDGAEDTNSAVYIAAAIVCVGFLLFPVVSGFLAECRRRP